MANSTHHMTARYGGLGGSFAAQLKAFADRTAEQVDGIFRDVVIEVGSRVIHLSPVLTGRFKGNWQLTVDAPATASLTTTDPDGERAIAALVAKAQDLKAGQVAYIANLLAYAVPLEYGHSQKAPAGMVRITIAEFDRIVAEAAAKNT